MIDIFKPVKFVNPQPGEEKLVFQIVNFNKETERCYIKVINVCPWRLNSTIASQELVSVNDLVNIS